MGIIKRTLEWIQKAIRKLFIMIGLTVLACMMISVLLVLTLRWINPIGTVLMVERKYESWQQGVPLNLQRQWVGWDNISNHLKVAVIAAEDQNFPVHHGFDWDAIENALAHNAKGGSLRGASTISQQVAKNIFLWSGRSWVRKGFEVWFTAWLELLWSKQRILEIYLNSVEWGNGIFGAEAAAQYYFKTSAKNLTKEQASLLAAVLPNPRKWNPAKPTPYIINRAAFIRQQMNNLGNERYLKKLDCQTSDCK